MAWTINNGSLFMNTKLYTGNGGTQAVTGVGFQPDWCWIKNRGASESHALFDAVRGVQKSINSNSSSAEATSSNYLTAFGTDGFTVGASGLVNDNSNNYVSWNWKAGTAVSGNTSGSGTYKTYTGSVNTTSGFSIIKYVGNGTAGHTIPHHLGTANIASIFVKNLDSGSDYWYSYHKPLGATKTLILNETDAVGTNTMWNNTAPTSSVFSVGALSGSNSNNANYIAYIFLDIQGYCKTGTYTGNGSADGTFVYTGFKPAWVMSKSYTNTESWIMKDVARDPFNPVEKNLAANSVNSESTWGTAYDIDILSNGFKMRDASGQTNGNGYGFIYMAFAQNPITSSTGVPSTAR